MKKIYSFALAAAAIFSAASCQEELANNAPQTEGGDFTVVATTALTKTALAEDGLNVVWTPGDKISLFDSEGTAVGFTTDITAPAATAEFTNETEFNAPESLVAVYPHRVDENGEPQQSYIEPAGLIMNFRVGGSQNAVAGGFDPAHTGAIGLPSEEDGNKLQFKNVHSLVKFTIEGEEAPAKVKLANNGMRMIAGLYHYVLPENSVEHSGKGAGAIELNGPFEVGQTYYIAVIPGICGGGVTLYFDDKAVVNTGADVTLEPNKIYNLGSFAKPAPEPVIEEPFTLERVAARYSDGANAWCSFIEGISNRTMACDGENIYLQSSEGTAKIYAIDVESFMSDAETPSYKVLSTANISGGTHAVSALRCMPNENGDPILIATNLAENDSQIFNIYAYSNGVDADPVLLHAYRWDGVANANDWRRYGDRISVSGTWQNGSIWAASQSGTKVMGFRIENGATDDDHREYCWFDGWGGGLAEATIYPGTTEAVLTTASSAQFFSKTTGSETHAGGWPKWIAGNKNADLNGAFSFQFFTYAEKNYIAYVKMIDNTHANLVVVEDKGSLEESLASYKFFNLPLYEGEQASCVAGNTYGDCAVVTINGKLHIVAMMQGGGLSIFEIK